MNYQNKWKLFLEQTLLEGRFERTIQKYPQMEEILNFLKEKDETGRFVEVYSEWLAKNIKERIDGAFEILGMRVPDEDMYTPSSARDFLNQLINAINEFPFVKQKLRIKDPNQYSSTDKFISAVSQASENRKDTEGYKKYIERASQIEGDLIYKNGKELIVATVAGNFEESCDLGYPAWCVSLSATKGTHYDAYKNRGNKIYFIHHFFIPKASIKSEEFSKTAIQKELSGKMTVWNERDNSREIEDYKRWLIAKLGQQKGEYIFDSIMASIQTNWEEKARPKEIVMNTRQKESMRFSAKYAIKDALRRSSSYDVDTYPPEINLDKFLVKSVYSQDDFFPNILGEWVANLGEITLKILITYEDLGLGSEFKNKQDLRDSLSEILSLLVRDEGDPSVYTTYYVDDDGVEISFNFKIYGILFQMPGGSMQFSESLGYGMQTAENRQIINRYIPDFIADVEDAIYDLIDNENAVVKRSERLFENKKTIIIRVG